VLGVFPAVGVAVGDDDGGVVQEAVEDADGGAGCWSGPRGGSLVEQFAVEAICFAQAATGLKPRRMLCWWLGEELAGLWAIWRLRHPPQTIEAVPVTLMVGDEPTN
jgi:hypothetical protein